MISTLWESLLDLLFPPRPGCPFCGAPGSGTEVCCTCLSTISGYRLEPHCCLCGRLPEKMAPSAPDGYYLCSECRRHGWPFVLARAAGPYEGILKEVIHRFKYGGSRRLAVPLAALMVEVLLSETLYANIDLVLPVPLTYNKLRRRGFNQAGLLAKEIGSGLKIPVSGSVLVKITDTPSQTGLSRAAREINLKNVFKVTDARYLQGKNILIVDDVFTTGSTMSSAAAVVKRAGAVQVFVVTAATGRCS
ncbi:MAG: DNA utilization protein GntX [Pelotomaculum sp. PtaB.Bin013]|uniref:ComF family protein n=1 Tax=Pelotomaculum isophthalicicum JI TaxID=947010 RepID=A0A9X4H242_9FIRM|nr:ComF family protein [Pelotomaculum isophthalicicum]MDF9406978.1 ComF family protein [Pelotomaculum isophthalicicum JI]OPX85735.1 MAG: DNA utilization protein GntX [Pelotomaculum sp. PtaB.Bin013]